MNPKPQGNLFKDSIQQQDSFETNRQDDSNLEIQKAELQLQANLQAEFQSNRQKQINFQLTNTQVKSKPITRCQSSDSNHSKQEKNIFIPEPPLDLFDGKSNLHAGGGKRAQLNQPRGFLIGSDLQCQHENSNNISDWFCKECNLQISQFDCIFDDFQGRVHQFVKIKYENNFLEDFLHAQIDNQSPRLQSQNIQSDATQNQDWNDGLFHQMPFQKTGKEIKRNFNSRRVPDIIYQQYQPTNTTELREYMLFCMSKDQQAYLIKLRNTDQLNQNGQPQEPVAQIDGQQTQQNQVSQKFEEEKQIFGSGSIRNISQKLLKYLSDYEESQERLLNQYKNDVLLIDSIFESGNLLQADRIDTSDYNMYMQVDSNTKGHQQWFNFRVRNTRKNKKYYFHIMNFTKPGVTGGNGFRKNELKQRVFYKSELSGKQEWSTISSSQLTYLKTKVARRKKDVMAGGADSDQDEDIEEMFGVNDQNQQQSNGLFNNQDYGRMSSGPIKKDIFKKRKTYYYYALVFEVEFEFDDDTVFFAFSQQYTYTQIMREILSIEAQAMPEDKSQIRILQKPLTKTVTQQDISQKSEKKISNPPAQQFQNQQQQPARPQKQPLTGIQFNNNQSHILYKREELCRSILGLPLWVITITRESPNQKKKPVVLITSRVHSGETPASIVFKGILDFLMSDRKEAKLLRLYYTFVLVPCLNPDGVACGNYRNSISGVDLNRQWVSPDEMFHPEIFHTKDLLRRLTEVQKRQIWVFCDIHGHSKKKNAFFYGCNTAANGGFLSWTIVRLLPRIFAQKTHVFNFKDCRFKVEPYKFGTGRVVAWKQFQITHSFTLENSFYGYDFGEEESREFSEDDYLTVGSKLCDSIFELHYVWKQIQRELNLTNGWLKPRVLNEKTGIPAAQLLQEELAHKKKQEEKQASIELYKNFLSKFYNKGTHFQTVNKLPKSQNRIQSQEQGYQSQKNLFFKTETNKQSPESIEKYLEGLIKIQARVRGWLQRKKSNPLLNEIKLNRILIQKKKTENISSFKTDLTNLASAQNRMNPLLQSLQTSENGSELNQFFDKAQVSNQGFDYQFQENSSLRSGISKLTGKPTGMDQILNRDWRAYFNVDELETAFQEVEVKNQDHIPEEDSCDSGSNSNPSEDNFDTQEIFEKVYQLPSSQAQQKIKDNQVSIQLLSRQSPVSAALMYSRLRGQSGSQQFQQKNLTSNGQFYSHGSSLNNQNDQSQLLSSDKQRQNAILNKNNQYSSQYQSVKPLYLGKQQFFYNQLQNGKNQDIFQQLQANSEMENELYHIYAGQQNQARQFRETQQTLNQNAFGVQIRGHTSQFLDMYIGIKPVGSSILQNGITRLSQQLKQQVPELYYGQLRMMNNTQVQGSRSAFGKREYMNQVIKDCFITKKCGVAQPANNQFEKRLSTTTKVQPVKQITTQNKNNLGKPQQNDQTSNFTSLNQDKQQNITHPYGINNIIQPLSMNESASPRLQRLQSSQNNSKRQQTYLIQLENKIQTPDINRRQIKQNSTDKISDRLTIIMSPNQERLTSPYLNQESNQNEVMRMPVYRVTQQKLNKIRLQQGKVNNNVDKAFKMSGIRVVQQPNSNLTYITSYPNLQKIPENSINKSSPIEILKAKKQKY